MTIASGFVDDWSAACRGIAALLRVQELTDIFQTASGQKINASKSALVPTRALTEDECTRCRARWQDLKISHRERLLGLYIGTKATIADQYTGPMKKFDALLPKLRAAAGSWSTALRIVAVNTFL